MSQQSVERILGRLITDPGFRERFFAEPASACRDDAFDLTPVELSAVLQVGAAAVETMAARLDPRIVRASAVDTASTTRAPENERRES